MRSWRYLLLFGMVWIGGCQSYQSKVINPQRIDQELAVPAQDVLRVQARSIHHPLLQPIDLDMHDGLSPDEAAILAVLLNPSLRAQRDRRNLASAQLMAAGILPNPQLTAGLDVPTGGNTRGTLDGYVIGLSWDLSSLITVDARKSAAAAEAQSVDLDVAWQEWQVAQAAKSALYDVVALQVQVAQAELVDRNMAENRAVLQRAVAEHQKTLVDLTAAEAASQDAHATLLGLRHDLRHQQLLLNQALGVPPQTVIRPDPSVTLPSTVLVPTESQLDDGLEDRRLDLLALKQGYKSQDEAVRSAVLAQFPNINVGFNRSSDTSNVHTTGFGVTIDLPIFDRNQGRIATERATRQQLYDEYVNRVFEARSQIAISLADMRLLAGQIAAAQTALPSQERLVSTYHRAVERGNGDILSYYAAESTLAQKQLDLLKLKQQLAENKIALEIAAGRYLPAEAAPATRPATKEFLP